MQKLLFFAVFLILCSFIRSANLDKQEVEVLRESLEKLGFNKWDFDENLCSKEFILNIAILCDCAFASNTTCHVTQMDIYRLISAPIPLEFAKLQHLDTLYMMFCYLTGSIPSEWATMRLSTLVLTGNLLSGPFPAALTRMTTLQTLKVDGNNFSGSIPEEIANLKNLQILDLSSNDFTGPLPIGLAKLTNLTDLRISDNNFIGNIPSFIGQWTQLGTLHIQGCSFNGPLPSTISKLTKLEDLRISDLKGGASTFPSLEKMTKLRTLVLRKCLINGLIPDYIMDMIYLNFLDLSFNNLIGQIYYSSNSPQYIYLTHNNLTGQVPPWIFLSNKNVDVSYNHYSCSDTSFPKKCTKKRTNLVESCSLSSNTIIDPCLRKDFPCTKSKNQEMIYSLHINCGGEDVNINDTKFDADTDECGSSTYNNHDKWAFSNTGKFLDYRLDCEPYIRSNTSSLDNILKDDVGLYTTARASAISLTYYGLCLMNGNYTVKLHFAEIVFTQDQSGNILGKRVFDVFVQGELKVKDFNIVKEAGGIGKAVIKTYTVIVKDNTLKIQLYWAGKGTTRIPDVGSYGPIISAISVLPNFNPPKFRKKNTNYGLVIGMVAGGIFLFFLIINIAIWWRTCYIRGRREHMNTEHRDIDLHTRVFTREELITATRNFHSSNKLGKGGFGCVYKGKLSDGTIVAVKQLSQKSEQGTSEFLTEIGMISTLNHENLVKLYGFCTEGQLCLVYEYMPNNSLAQALSDSKEKLTWTIRKNICIGLAQGLAYLHEESKVKIIHRDIKPSNILLDEDFNAKISDFGLAKRKEKRKSEFSKIIKGTRFYIAPEYATSGYLTPMADVFSFGLVLLEIVSGISNAKCLPEADGFYLLHWAIVLNERGGNLLDLIDPDLQSVYSSQEALTIINVALLCTNLSPILRPTMSQTIDMLMGRSTTKDFQRISTRNYIVRNFPFLNRRGALPTSDEASTGSSMTKTLGNPREVLPTIDEAPTESFVTDSFVTDSFIRELP